MEDHINNIENKVSKYIELIFRVKNVLNKDSLTKLFHSYFHCYLNCTNVAWGSTQVTKD